MIQPDMAEFLQRYGVAAKLVRGRRVPGWAGGRPCEMQTSSSHGIAGWPGAMRRSKMAQSMTACWPNCPPGALRRRRSCVSSRRGGSTLTCRSGWWAATATHSSSAPGTCCTGERQAPGGRRAPETQVRCSSLERATPSSRAAAPAPARTCSHLIPCCSNPRMPRPWLSLLRVQGAAPSATARHLPFRGQGGDGGGRRRGSVAGAGGRRAP